VLALMAMINLTSTRLGSDYTLSENYNSVFAISYFLVVLSYPFVIIAVYQRKLERVEPYPNLNKNMTLEQIEEIYGTIDIDWIKNKAYTD